MPIINNLEESLERDNPENENISTETTETTESVNQDEDEIKAESLLDRANENWEFSSSTSHLKYSYNAKNLKLTILGSSQKNNIGVIFQDLNVYSRGDYIEKITSIELDYEAQEKPTFIINNEVIKGSYGDTIGLTAFKNLERLIVSEASVIFENTRTLSNKYNGPFNNLKKLETITGRSYSFGGEIPSRAFQNCESLKSVDFSNVTTIDDYAFDKCNNLNTVNLPNAAIISTFNEYYQFFDCPNLENVTLGQISTENTTVFKNSPIKSLEVSIFDTSKGEELRGFDKMQGLVNSLEKLTIKKFTDPSKLQHHKEQAGTFSNFPNLKSIAFGNNTQEWQVPNYLFKGANILTAKILGATKLGDYSFSQSKLTEIEIPTANEIGQEAFFNSDLNFLIGPSVQKIGKNAFGQCDKLLFCYFESDNISIDDSVFNGITKDSKLALIYAPKSINSFSSLFEVFNDVLFMGYTGKQTDSYRLWGKEKFDYSFLTNSSFSQRINAETASKIRQTITYEHNGDVGTLPGNDFIIDSLEKDDEGIYTFTLNLIFTDENNESEKNFNDFLTSQQKVDFQSEIELGVIFPNIQSYDISSEIGNMVYQEVTVKTNNNDFIIEGNEKLSDLKGKLVISIPQNILKVDTTNITINDVETSSTISEGKSEIIVPLTLKPDSEFLIKLNYMPLQKYNGFYSVKFISDEKIIDLEENSLNINEGDVIWKIPQEIELGESDINIHMLGTLERPSTLEVGILDFANDSAKISVSATSFKENGGEEIPKSALSLVYKMGEEIIDLEESFIIQEVGYRTDERDYNFITNTWLNSGFVKVYSPDEGLQVQVGSDITFLKPHKQYQTAIIYSLEFGP